MENSEMSLSSDTATAVHQVFIGLLGRPPTKEGLAYWVEQIDADNDFGLPEMMSNIVNEQAEYADFFGGESRASIVTTHFNFLFGRDPYYDTNGENYWIHGDGAAMPADQLALALIQGASAEDMAVLSNKVIVANFITSAMTGTPDSNRDILSDVGASNDSVNEGIDAALGGATDVHTLEQPSVLVEIPAVEGELITKTVTYWGYNPHGHGEDGVDNLDGNDPDGHGGANGGNDNNLTNEGPADGGVPVSAFLDYLYALATDLNRDGSAGDDIDNLLGKLDSIGVDNTSQDTPDFSSVTTITVSGVGGTGGDDGGDGGSTTTSTPTFTVGYENDAGEIAEAEVQLGALYTDMIHDLIFDEEGNSRLFEVEVAVQVAALDAETGMPIEDINGDLIGIDFYYGASEGDSFYVDVPIVLTTSENNGSTLEGGYTTADDDIVVAGRLDILHQAYIDAGAGWDSLEIDAKGHFAQPYALLNVEHVSVQNLANIYTNDDGDNGSDYPDVIESEAGDEDSIIDLSRAIDLQWLTISQGEYESHDASADVGDLTVSGVRNGATVEFVGYFDEDVLVNFADGTGDGINVVLNNVNGYEDYDLSIAHNSPTLNIESIGGGNFLYGNYLTWGTDVLINLNISGDTRLVIDDEIDDWFQSEATNVIDASANTGGVTLDLGDPDTHVVFIGTEEADDHIEIDGADRSATVIGGDGDNEFYVDADGDVDVIAGDGDNRIYAEAGEEGTGTEEMDLEANLTVTVGDGHNNIIVDSDDAFTITAGNGNNLIEATGDRSADADSVTDSTDNSLIFVGNGNNQIDVTTARLGLFAGSGDDQIDVDILGGLINAGDGANIVDVDSAVAVTVNAGSGDDEIEVTGVLIAR
jgi:hypothetical protein